MDLLFSKEELASSLLFKSKSKKSLKPPLEQKRVEELLQAVDAKFGANSYDIKVLTAKANQKCRDSKEKEMKCEDQQ